MADKEAFPPAKYVKFLNMVIEKMQQNLKNFPKLLPVAFLLNNETNKTQIIGMPFRNEEDKESCAAMLKDRAIEMQADAICFLSEAWTLPEKYRTKEMIDSILQQYGEIANFPERMEIVTIQLETYEGIWMATGSIREAKKGRKISGLRWMNANQAEGRFVHLLPSKEDKTKH